VDAANLELVLAPRLLEAEDFQGGKLAVIDQDTCAGCGTCAEVCRFDAIHEQGGSYQVDPFACDGCAACVYQCPTESIHMQVQTAGKLFFSESRYGPLFHAALRPAQENSGKLVTLVKQRARLLALDEDLELVLVDGPPGIGCPVISAVSGADLVLIVAEPTASGTHDMERVVQTAAHFGIPAVVCVNKADLYPAGTAKIEQFCREHELELVGQIPFDQTVTTAMVQGEAVTAYGPDTPASQSLQAIWEKLVARLGVLPT
jgi:MinD superfamily P-loop ATPase